MTPEAFIAARSSTQGAFRRAGALYRLLDEPTPAEADPTGDAYALSVARDLRDRAGGIGDAEVGDELGG